MAEASRKRRVRARGEIPNRSANSRRRWRELTPEASARRRAGMRPDDWRIIRAAWVTQSAVGAAAARSMPRSKARIAFDGSPLAASVIALSKASCSRRGRSRSRFEYSPARRPSVASIISGASRTAICSSPGSGAYCPPSGIAGLIRRRQSSVRPLRSNRRRMTSDGSQKGSNRCTSGRPCSTRQYQARSAI